ncbi:MAG: peptidoglycan DD-metalloendopeptidase family protein [Actinobacteria bacterium]|nr:peptidoglycan DD-metalloendopeptidase family protein [Actinomycetota bacterium]
MKHTARTLSALLALVVAIPAFAQVTDEDIDQARREVNRIVAESQELGAAIQETWARQAELEAEIAELQASIEHAHVQLAELRGRVEEVAVEMYMGSTSASNLTALLAASDGGNGAGLSYLKEVNGFDADVINQLRVFRRELDRQTERLAEASAEQQILAAEMEEMAAGLQEDLVAAQEVYDQLIEQQRREEEERRRQEEERRRREAEERARAEEAARQATSTTTTTATSSDATTATIAPSPTTTVVTTTTTAPAPPLPATSGGTCPVAGAVSFTDSWGDPRSGGRSHRGVDMIAARGTPIVAIYSGTIRRFSNSSLGGKSIYFMSDAGDQYYYAHLDGFADVSAGQHVAQGTVIGYNGSTGNAPSWLPHLHFEYHPGGGSAINPYPLVKRLCG